MEDEFERTAGEELAGGVGLAVLGDGETGRPVGGLAGSRVLGALGEGETGRTTGALTGSRGLAGIGEGETPRSQLLSAVLKGLAATGEPLAGTSRGRGGLRFPAGQLRTGNLGPKRGILEGESDVASSGEPRYD